MLIYINYPLIWSQGVVDKVLEKHEVTPEEVDEAVIDDEAICHRVSRGSYCVYGQTASGRYIFTVLKIAGEKGKFKVITAREMQDKEKRYYHTPRHCNGWRRYILRLSRVERYGTEGL